MYLINPALTLQQNIIAMINFGARNALTGDEFTIGPATPYVPRESEEGTNTTILLTSVEGSGYKGEHSPRYRRLTVGNTRPGALQAYSIESEVTIEELKQLICENHLLLQSDVVFSGMTELPAAGEQATLTCTAKPDSYFYIGSFDFTISRPAVEVEEP